MEVQTKERDREIEKKHFIFCKNISGSGFLVDNREVEVFYFCKLFVFRSTRFLFENLLNHIYSVSQVAVTFQRAHFILTGVLKSREELSSFL